MRMGSEDDDVLPQATPAPLVVDFEVEEVDDAPIIEPQEIGKAEPRSEITLPEGAPSRPGLARVVTVINQKGGVGKTTTVINVAAHLALKGLRVLVIDCDQQGNCATGLGIDKTRVQHTTRTLIMEPELAVACRHATAIPGLHMVVGDRSLIGMEQEMSSELGREARLSEAIESLLPHYDIILVDTPPSLGTLSLNALVASDGVLVPVQTEYFALEGVAMLVNTVKEVRRRLNPRLGFDGVMMTMHAPTVLNAGVKAQLEETFGDLIVGEPIRRNIKLAESSSEGVPIHVHAPNSNGGRDYRVLADALAARWGFE